MRSPSLYHCCRANRAKKTEPLYLACLALLVVSLIINSMLIAGCTSPIPGVRKFYLISLKYNPDASKSQIVTGLDKLLKSDKGDSQVFSDVRIGYSGICIETKKKGDKGNGSWRCSKHARDISKDMAGDPVNLIRVADLYKDKISFVTPLYMATCALVVAFLMVLINCVPVIPVPAATRKIATAAAATGSLMLLGCMSLQHVTSAAISTLVSELGMNAVLVHIGDADAAFGWAAYALSALAALATLAVAVAEHLANKAQAVADAPIGFLEKGASGLASRVMNRGGSSHSGSTSATAAGVHTDSHPQPPYPVAGGARSYGPPFYNTGDATATEGSLFSSPSPPFSGSSSGPNRGAPAAPLIDAAKAKIPGVVGGAAKKYGRGGVSLVGGVLSGMANKGR